MRAIRAGVVIVTIVISSGAFPRVGHGATCVVPTLRWLRYSQASVAAGRAGFTLQPNLSCVGHGDRHVVWQSPQNGVRLPCRSAIQVSCQRFPRD